MQENCVQIENDFFVTILDRMLKEKYGEIQYLAIQPKPDPTITQINNTDLDYLLRERDRCEEQEQELRKQEEELRKYEEEMHQQRMIVERTTQMLHEVQSEYQAVLDSRTWRWGKKVSHMMGRLLYPFRWIKRLLNHV